MSILSKEQILSAARPPSREVACPEWGGNVYVKGFGARERTRYMSMLTGGKVPTGGAAELDMDKLGDALMYVVTTCVVDEAGVPLFADATEDEIETLAQTSHAPIERIWQTVLELSGLADDPDEKGLDPTPG